MYLAKELATAASLDGDRAIFIGRKDKTSFAQLFTRYMIDNVTCPVCGSPDTHIVTESRLALQGLRGLRRKVKRQGELTRLAAPFSVRSIAWKNSSCRERLRRRAHRAGR